MRWLTSALWTCLAASSAQRECHSESLDLLQRRSSYLQAVDPEEPDLDDKKGEPLDDDDGDDDTLDDDVGVMIIPGQAPEAKGTGWSALHPDPSVLVWDWSTWSPEPKYGGNFVLDGTLTVPLDPTDEDTPNITLKVKMLQLLNDAGDYLENAPDGPILYHCGGPGSTSACGIEVGLQAHGLLTYNIWGIDQRGVGESFPSLACERPHLPATKKDKYEISDFTSCPCALPDGTPLVGDMLVDLDTTNETAVRDLMFKMGQRAACRASPKFQLTGKNGKSYNFLDYVGTNLLARDIEAVRKAIGAEFMSIRGVSYGTMVGAVYASSYPASIKRLVLNSNVMPLADTLTFSTARAKGLDQALWKVLDMCHAQKHCLTFDGHGYLRKLAAAGHLNATTKSGKTFYLSWGLLAGSLIAKLFDDSGDGWADELELVRKLGSQHTTASERSEAVRSILDERCVINSVPTWYEYDVCIGAGQVAYTDPADTKGDSFIEMLAILGSDLTGRFTLDQAMRHYQEILRVEGPSASVAFLGSFAGWHAWPSTPLPPAPLGNPSLRALIVGNLYDPATPYEWTQQMHQAFPAGSVITYQGVGHVMKEDKYDQVGSDICVRHVTEYLKSGILPRNGIVCDERKHLGDQLQALGHKLSFD